jgi:hypothetical protein
MSLFDMFKEKASELLGGAGDKVSELTGVDLTGGEAVEQATQSATDLADTATAAGEGLVDSATTAGEGLVDSAGTIGDTATGLAGDVIDPKLP